MATTTYEAEDYDPLPGSDKWKANEAAKRQSEPSSTSQDGPPDMGEPPDEAQPVLPPPRNAPLHLAMVLATMRDPAQRQLLLDTYAEMGPGLSQELFGQVGAYLSAILDHQIKRSEEHAEDLVTIAGAMNDRLEQYAVALDRQITAAPGSAQVQARPSDLSSQGEALRKIVAGEVNRAVNAAREVQGRVLLIACGCAFLLGIVVAAVFVHWF